MFSPDGRHIAHVCDESGREEVHVQPLPAIDHRIQISTGGGLDPVWSRDGKELFYRAGNSLMAVDVAVEPRFSVGRPSGSSTSTSAREGTPGRPATT